MAAGGLRVQELSALFTEEVENLEACFLATLAPYDQCLIIFIQPSRADNAE